MAESRHRPLQMEEADLFFWWSITILDTSKLPGCTSRHPAKSFPGQRVFLRDSWHTGDGDVRHASIPLKHTKSLLKSTSSSTGQAARTFLRVVERLNELYAPSRSCWTKTTTRIWRYTVLSYTTPTQGKVHPLKIAHEQNAADHSAHHTCWQSSKSAWSSCCACRDWQKLG